MSKHTPGPWKVSKTDNAIKRITGAKTPEQVEADARLIENAPELLKALNKLAEAIHLNFRPKDLKPHFDRAIAVLAKIKDSNEA